MVRFHREGDGDAQQQGDQIGQLILGGLRQGGEHSALPDEIAEHKEAHQSHRGGGYQPGDHRDDNGE